MKPKNNPENFGKCFCPDCPLFTDCNRNKAERLFCARTTSTCPMDTNKSCSCPADCPVYEENKLTGAYFCRQEIE